MTKTIEKIKPGYKKTKLGLIPEDWEVKKVNNFTTTTAGATPSTLIEEYWNGEIKWMSSGELNNKIIYNVEGRITEKGFKNSSTKILPKKCILIGLAGQGKTRGTVAINMVELCTNQSVAAILPSKYYFPKYLYFNLDNRYYELRKLSTGEGGRGGLNLKIINSLLVPLPPFLEQQKIAEILTCWDNAIEKTEKLIETKTQLKKGLMQQLLTGKTRFKEFVKEEGFKKTKYSLMPLDWENKSFNKLFKERKETSNDTNTYPLYSLTIEKGVVPKTQQYERSFLLKNKEENQYRLIYENDIIYNPMNIRFGAIARSNVSEVVAVSAYYNIMQIKSSDFCPYFIEYLLKSPLLFHIYETRAIGSLIEKKRVHLSEFIKISIDLPTFEEQQKIAAVLTTCDKEIETLNKQLEALKKEKKGLMQKLLTGKVRVKV